jgi:hypothetical protein
MIYKFQPFLEAKYETGGRGEVIKMSREDALKQYVPWYDWYGCKTPLYRCVENYQGPVKKVDPTKYTRGTLNETNSFYQLIIDSWSNDGYPKRSSSIITSTSHHGLHLYGKNLFRVIPIKENSKVLFTPTDDMWAGFDLRECMMFLGMREHNSLNNLSEFMVDKVFKLDRNYIYDDINKLKEYLDKVSGLIREGKVNNILNEQLEGPEEFFMNYPGGLYELLVKTLSPNNPPGDVSFNYSDTKYDLLDYNNETEVYVPNNVKRYGREAYTSEECLLVFEEENKRDEIYR